MLLCQAPEGNPAGGGLLAAALAGRLAAAADPSAALNGAVLEGITGLSKAFPEEELDILLQNGVAVLEMRAGRAELIRGVSTRTKTDGVSDRTFHDINTVLIIDTVIAGIRASLKRMLAGARNNEKTRSALATQTAVKLEEYRLQGILDSYRSPVVAASGEDPSVCVVTVEFTAARGLNQIVIQASITV